MCDMINTSGINPEDLEATKLYCPYCGVLLKKKDMGDYALLRCDNFKTCEAEFFEDEPKDRIPRPSFLYDFFFKELEPGSNDNVEF